MDGADFLGLFAGAGLIGGLIGLAVGVFFLIAMWKIFTKAGIEGWKSLIPFYNTYLMFELAWGKGIMFLCTFIPVAGFVFPLICLYKLACAFGKGTGFAIATVIFPYICLPMIAFGDARYIGPA